MAAEISVHDNLILSYTVECEQRRITLHTAFFDNEPNEYTDVTFSGVVAYHFEGDTFGTILFDISEVPPLTVYEDYEEVFVRRRNYGWPVLQYGAKEELLDKFNPEGIKAYRISSSYGMDGFVLAREIRIYPVA
jgi:hypothetical protein